MSGHKDSFKDRLSNASAARKTALTRFEERPKADSLELTERKAARVAAGAARDVRLREKRQAKEAELAAAKAERAAQLQEKILLEQKQAAEAELTRKKMPTEAELKAARDARYAARKARR